VSEPVAVQPAERPPFRKLAISGWSAGGALLLVDVDRPASRLLRRQVSSANATRGVGHAELARIVMMFTSRRDPSCAQLSVDVVGTFAA
jgi:hypothetical protein